MSWLSENYDKAALGVAAVAAVAVGYSIFSGGNDVEAPKTAVPNNTVEIEQRGVLATAIEKFSADYEFVEKKSSGNEVTSFVSFPLYSIKGQEGVKSLTDDFEIHPGMPLKWWKKYNLKSYNLEDAPETDSDDDGFDNRAEFDADTDPTDAKSHPDFIAKLKSSGIKDQTYTLNWTNVSDVQSMFSFKVKDNKDGLKRESPTTMTGIGGKFPEKSKNESFTNRFEIKERKQDPDISGEKGEYYLLLDTAELNNHGTFKLYYSEKKELKDYTATLYLDIDGKNTPFDVTLGEKFSLPHDDATKPKAYTFKSQKENKVEIEYEVDGKKKTAEIEVTPSK